MKLTTNPIFRRPLSRLRTLCTAISYALLATVAIIAIGCQSESDQEMPHNGHDDSAHSHDAGMEHDHGTEAKTRIEFASEPAAIPVGKPATWTIRVVDTETGEPVKDFDLAHEKLMHLIVVSFDLSWFNHIHPEHKGDGVFTVETTLPTEGSYRLYADYTPKGGSQEIAQHEFATGGQQPTPTMILPVHDTVGPNGWIVKTAGAAPGGFPEQATGNYHVALMPMPAEIRAGEDVMLHFEVRDESGRPIDKLEPYLGAMGHVVVISSDGTQYLHVHPMEEGADAGDHGGRNGEAHEPSSGDAPSGSDAGVMFHTNFPEAGFYKVWGQFQHNGRIVTAPFVLKVDTKGT